MTTPTYREPQHPRDGNGQWKSKGWSGPKHSMSGRTQVKIGAAGLAVSGMGMVSSAFNLVTAILTVTTVSLLAWGGYKGAKKRKRRRSSGISRRPAAKGGTRVTRFGTVRLGDEKAIAEFAKWQQQRWARRDAQWAKRRGAAMSAVRRLRPVKS